MSLSDATKDYTLKGVKKKGAGGWYSCGACGKKCQRKAGEWRGYCGWCWYATGPGSYR